LPFKTIVCIFPPAKVTRGRDHRQLNYSKTLQSVEGEKTGDGISYASHVKNPNPLKARATTFYDPVHNALDKEAQCAWKEGEGSHWPSVYIQKPFMTL
jgi:hypothetical protein